MSKKIRLNDLKYKNVFQPMSKEGRSKLKVG